MKEKLKLPHKLLDEGINSQAKIMYEEFISQLNMQDKAFNEFKDQMNEILNTITDPIECNASLLVNEVLFVAQVLKFFANKFYDQVEKMYESGELFNLKIKEIKEINDALKEREMH